MKTINFTLTILIIGLSSCSDTSNSNKLESDDYDTKEKRVEILKKEIKSFSNFENAEFELFNVNGFSNSRTTLPGASSWDYKFVIKVESSKVDKWTHGMIKTKPDNYDDGWMTEIIKERKSEWKTGSEPEFYIRKGDNVIMVVYQDEGIIFKRVINN